MTKKSAFHVMCGKEKKPECMTMPVTSYLADRLFTEQTFATLISATPFFHYITMISLLVPRMSAAVLEKI